MLMFRTFKTRWPHIKWWASAEEMIYRGSVARLLAFGYQGDQSDQRTNNASQSRKPPKEQVGVLSLFFADSGTQFSSTMNSMGGSFASSTYLLVSSDLPTGVEWVSDDD
jgi:hypothetical protein